MQSCQEMEVGSLRLNCFYSAILDRSKMLRELHGLYNIFLFSTTTRALKQRVIAHVSEAHVVAVKSLDCTTLQNLLSVVKRKYEVKFWHE